MKMKNDMENILYKYFKDDKTLYYHPWDSIANEHYLKWRYLNGNKKEICISVGSNDGEVDLKICTNEKSLEELIKILIK